MYYFLTLITHLHALYFQSKRKVTMGVLSNQVTLGHVMEGAVLQVVLPGEQANE